MPRPALFAHSRSKMDVMGYCALLLKLALAFNTGSFVVCLVEPPQFSSVLTPLNWSSLDRYVKQNLLILLPDFKQSDRSHLSGCTPQTGHSSHHTFIQHHHHYHSGLSMPRHAILALVDQYVYLANSTAIKNQCDYVSHFYSTFCFRIL